MEYKKKSLSNLDIKKDYEEIDTRLASGWYVDDLNTPKKRIYKTKKTSFKLSKKLNYWWNNFFLKLFVSYKTFKEKSYSLINLNQ